MYSLSPVALEINGMTITRYVRHQLIKAYAEPKYMQYLQQQKQVEQQDSTFNSIEMPEPRSKDNR